MKLSTREDCEMQAITKALVWARGSKTWTQYCQSMDHSLVANMAMTDMSTPYTTHPTGSKRKNSETTHSQNCFKGKR